MISVEGDVLTLSCDDCRKPFMSQPFCTGEGLLAAAIYQGWITREAGPTILHFAGIFCPNCQTAEEKERSIP